MTELKSRSTRARRREKIVKGSAVLELTDPVGEAAAEARRDGANGGAPAGGGAPAAGGVFVLGAIRTRAEAVSRLTEVAAFFRQTEPHSPVSISSSAPSSGADAA